MTESDWLAFDSPADLCGELMLVRQPRKLFLLAVAVLRRVEQLLPAESARQAVQALQDHANGRATAREVVEAFTQAWNETGEPLWLGPRATAAEFEDDWYGYTGPNHTGPVHPGAREALHDPSWFAARACFHAAELVAHSATPPQHRRLPLDERQTQWLLYRDIIDDPFAPPDTAPTTLRNNPDIRALLRRLDAEPSPDPLTLAVLGDALEEAGCTNEAILQHCRSPGPHGHGCWALEWLSGRASLVLEPDGEADLWESVTRGFWF